MRSKSVAPRSRFTELNQCWWVELNERFGRTRDALEAMTEEVFSGVRELVSRLLASSKVNPSQVRAATPLL